MPAVAGLRTGRVVLLLVLVLVLVVVDMKFNLSQGHCSDSKMVLIKVVQNVVPNILVTKFHRVDHFMSGRIRIQLLYLSGLAEPILSNLDEIWYTGSPHDPDHFATKISSGRSLHVQPDPDPTVISLDWLNQS